MHWTKSTPFDNSKWQAPSPRSTACARTSMPSWRKSTCLPAGRRGWADVLHFILLCDNGAYYKGFTNDLEHRYQEHLSGIAAQYTAKHKPIKIAYYETYETKAEAVAREKYFKSGCGREWLKKCLEEKP